MTCGARLEMRGIKELTWAGLLGTRLNKNRYKKIEFLVNLLVVYVMTHCMTISFMHGLNHIQRNKG
jgi:hypothetical protein